MNMRLHALERIAAAVSPMESMAMIYTYIKQWLGTLFRHLTLLCMNAYMSTPRNTAKLGTAHSNIQTGQSRPSLLGSEPTTH